MTKYKTTMVFYDVSRNSIFVSCFKCVINQVECNLNLYELVSFSSRNLLFVLFIDAYL